MVAIGQLMGTLNLRVIVSVVAGETTVSEYLLLEDDEFIWQAQRANTIEQLVEWVNENY